MANNVPEVAKEQNLNEKTEEVFVEKPASEDVPLEKTNRKLLVVGTIIFIIISLLSTGVYYFTTRVKSTKEIVSKVEPVKESVKEIVQLRREEITLEVLNGSGISGLAGKTADKFKTLGYQIIKTGNTEDSLVNHLLVNDSVKDKVNILLQDLLSELKISSISGPLTDSTAAARIVLGKDNQ